MQTWRSMCVKSWLWLVWLVTKLNSLHVSATNDSFYYRMIHQLFSQWIKTQKTVTKILNLQLNNTGKSSILYISTIQDIYNWLTWSVIKIVGDLSPSNWLITTSLYLFTCLLTTISTSDPLIGSGVDSHAWLHPLWGFSTKPILPFQKHRGLICPIRWGHCVRSKTHETKSEHVKNVGSETEVTYAGWLKKVGVFFGHSDVDFILVTTQ